MKYNCGTEVMLGDEIMVAYGPGQKAPARVVAIGRELATPDIERSFYTWAINDGIIADTTVVVEWIGRPHSPEKPQRAKGNYFMLQSLCCEDFMKRGQTGADPAPGSR